MNSTVSVRGQAIASGIPDEAEMSISISVLANAPEAALDDASRRSSEMDRIFDELEIEDSNLVTTGLSVRVETEYDRDSRRSVHRGYRATTSTSVTLSDASLVAKILREGTQRVGAEISGPHWHLSLDNPARVNAYESAARDAQRKAQAYVSALGARLGSILTISEPGTHRIERTYEDAMMAPSSSGDDFPEIEVHQGGLQVGAQVEVTFLVEQS